MRTLDPLHRRAHAIQSNNLSFSFSLLLLCLLPFLLLFINPPIVKTQCILAY